MNDLTTIITWRDALPEDARPGPTEMWMLAVMATFIGGDSTVIASFSEIASRYGCEDRNAKYLIAKLKKRGAIRVIGREDGKNVYVLEAFVPTQAPTEESVDKTAEEKFEEALSASIENSGDMTGLGSGLVEIPVPIEANPTIETPVEDIARAHDALRSASLDARELDGIAGALAPTCMLCGEEPQIANGGGSCATCIALEGL